MRPLRFCMVTTFYPPAHFGGDGVFVKNLAQALLDDGHHVEVVCCQDSYRLLVPGHVAPAIPVEPGGPLVHRLASPLRWLAPLVTNQIGHPLLHRRALRRILEGNFDVIHYHNVSLVGGPAVLSYGKGLKLYSTHEFWLVCPMHILQKYNRQPCEQRACLRCSLAFRRPPQWWRYADLLGRHAANVDVFLAPSQFCIDKHRAWGFGGPFVRLPHFAPDGGDPTGVPPASAARPYFLFVGRLEEIKGLHTLVPLFRDYPRAELWIAGRGRQQGELERLAGGSRTIRFLGHLDSEALTAAYRGATAVLVPSICNEVFPTVILEAFHHGRPVVARDLGGMPEMIADSGGGLLFHDDASFVRARELLLDDPAVATELGERARKAAASLYSRAAYLARYYTLIDERLAAKQARRAAR